MKGRFREAVRHDDELYCVSCMPGGEVVDELEAQTPQNCTTCGAPLICVFTGCTSGYVYERAVEMLEFGPGYWNRVVSFPPVPAEYRTSTVLTLMRGIASDKAPDRLPILCDALMDAGFHDEKFLGVLRDGIPGGLIDLDSLLSAVEGEGTAGDFYEYRRLADKVRDWMDQATEYEYPGEDDGLSLFFDEITAAGADVQEVYDRHAGAEFWGWFINREDLKWLTNSTEEAGQPTTGGAA
jgi:hypothetical protein